MVDFPTDLSAVTDNVDDVLAKHLNNIEGKIGVDGSAVTTSLDYIINHLDTTNLEDGIITQAKLDSEAIGKTDAKCRVYLGTIQENLSASSWHTVELDTEDYDIGDDFDKDTDHDFTAPVDGFYLVTAAINFKNEVAAKLYYGRVAIDGTGYAALVGGCSDNVQVWMSFSDIIYLATGEKVTMDARVDDDATVDINNGRGTFLAIHLLSKA